MTCVHRQGWQTGQRLSRRSDKPLKDAGVSDKLIHDFRQSAVRDMERAGIPRSVAMKISRHRTESVCRRHAIVSERDLLEAAKKIDSAKQVWAQFR